jgi:hypothetical protein
MRTIPSRPTARRIQPPNPQPPAQKHPPIRKLPAFWLGVLAFLIISVATLIDWVATPRLISLLAIDVSNSGLADPKAAENICRDQTQALKGGDLSIDIPYADTTETNRSSQVHQITQLFSRCNDYAHQKRPTTVGKNQGTSPIRLLERIQTQIQIQRKAGNHNAIAAVIWMQAAEPGSGLPALDFQVLAQQIQQITDDRGRIVIIGPTGDLRHELEKVSAQNPAFQVCSLAEHQSCIRDLFDAARNLPPK